jgi:hypothetical protein
MVSVNRLSSFLRAAELQPDARTTVHTDELTEGEEVHGLTIFYFNGYPTYLTH